MKQPVPTMVGAKIAEWQGLRADLAAVEAAEHPDITDHHGRTWTWIGGDLYRHDNMSWPLKFVTDGQHGLPSESALTNPNYDPCVICLGGTNE